MKLTDEQIGFLMAVLCELPLALADRKEDRIRQSCRKRGLVTYVRGHGVSRWRITDAGRAALRDGGEG